MSPIDILPAYQRALAQLPSGKFLGILVLASIITLVVTGPFLLVIVSIAALVDFMPLPGFLQSEGSWAGWSSWLFWTYIMSPLAVAIIGTLLEPIVEAVEARHYPGLPAVQRRGLGTLISNGLRFLGLMLLVSICAGLIAWLTPIPGWLIFTLASGYLIAREYYETVALRRLSEAEARSSTQARMITLWMAGIVVAITLNVPLLNLVSPILGVAAFTHLFHHGRHTR